MDQSAFVKRLYAIVAVGACGLMALVLVFMKGGLSPQGFAWAVLIWSIAMFATVFALVRSRQRSAEDIRKKRLVGEICGPPIRSNGRAPEARLAHPANPMWDSAASAFSCL
jgi:hypothetical protein